MELIRKLKQTEAQARELVEQARVEAARMAQEARQSRAGTLHQAEQERRKAIDQAVGDSRSAGAAEVEIMKQEALKGQQQLVEQVKGKMDQAVQRVMDYLKG